MILPTPARMTPAEAAEILGCETEAAEGDSVLVYRYSSERFALLWIIEKKDGRFFLVLDRSEYFFDRLADAERTLREWMTLECLGGEVVQ